MSYNAVTIPPSSAMSSPDASGLTPESNARDIAALTQALGLVVSQFVQPSVQQANANRETLDEVIDLLSRHAQGLLSQEQQKKLQKELSQSFVNLASYSIEKYFAVWIMSIPVKLMSQHSTLIKLPIKD